MSRTKRKNWLDTKTEKYRQEMLEWYLTYKRFRGNVMVGKMKNHTFQQQAESLGSAVDEDQLNTWDDRGGTSTRNKNATKERRRIMKEKFVKN